MVKANDTGPLVVHQPASPIYLNFAVPEQYLGPIRKYMAEGKLAVEASLPELREHRRDRRAGVRRQHGGLCHRHGEGCARCSRTRNRRCGPDSSPSPRSRSASSTNAIVVPSQAVQTGPKGQFVYVVKPDMTAELRQVVVERTDGGFIRHRQGAEPRRAVVTVGQSRLIPGIKVAPKARQGRRRQGKEDRPRGPGKRGQGT